MTARTPRGPVLGPVSTLVSAPAPLVYQMLCAIGQGAQRPGERAEIVAREGDELVYDFWTPVRLPLGWTRQVRTREAVRIMGPDTIVFRHLGGPLGGLVETITVRPLDDRRSRLEYEAVDPRPGLFAAIRARLARPMVEAVVRDHFTDLGRRAEERARRSKVFAPSDGADPISSSGGHLITTAATAAGTDGTDPPAAG